MQIKEVVEQYSQALCVSGSGNSPKHAEFSYSVAQGDEESCANCRSSRLSTEGSCMNSLGLEFAALVHLMRA